MSSESPSKNFPKHKIPNGVDLLVIGETWQLALCQEYLEAKKLNRYQLVAGPHSGLALPVHWGLGDSRWRSEKLYGRALASEIGKLSDTNFAKAGEAAKPSDSGFLRRFVTNALEIEATKDSDSFHATNEWEKERGWLGTVLEPVLRFDGEPEFASPVSEATCLRFEKLGPLRVSVDLGASSLEASFVLVLDDGLLATELEWARDKIIPVTVPVFHAPGNTPYPEDFLLLNGGADFVLRTGNQLRIGSYRSLYSDEAVGIQTRVNPKLQGFMQDYFHRLGWITGSLEETFLATVGVSCDGLPIVGTLPQFPNVYICTGFSGRGQNFLFRVLPDILEEIIDGKPPQSSKPFSSRRFV